MTEDDIIRARLLVDERPLKRLIKKFYAIASAPPDLLDSTYAQFVLEVTSQETINALKSKTAIVSNEETQAYEDEISRIATENVESEKLIASLKQELLLAQQSRRNKIVYDSIAKEALKLPSRSHSADTVQRLSAELRDLESEQERYGLTWANRQDAFGAVVKSLEDLGQMVKEEKSEQERKDALRDDDGGEDQVKPSEQEDMQTNAETTTQDKPKLDPKAPDFNPSSTNGQPVRQFSEYGAMQVDDNDSAAEPVADERFRRSHSASTKEEGEEDEKDDA